MNLNSKGGVRAAQILAVLVVVLLIAGVVYGVYEFLHWAKILGQLD